MTVLTLAQMLYYFGISVDLTFTGLVGYRLTPVPALATLPFALISLGSWAGTYPASQFMKRHGRRWGFLVGSSAAVIGGVISVTALYTREFALFCLGVGLIGVYQAFASYYRYAAADLYPIPQRGKAISTVLTGGVVAAIAGPLLATTVQHALGVEFAGAYALVTVLAVLSTAVLMFLPGGAAVAPEPRDDTAAQPTPELPRPLMRIIRQPVFVTGLAGCAVGNLVMMLLMTAAPIAAVHAGHSVDQGAHVVQWHLEGMYATAFLSGPLTRRFGAARTLVIGTTVIGAGAVVASSGLSAMAFMIGLGLVGIGWNVMFVAGSALVAASYRPNERATVQGMGEVFTQGGGAAGALAAGPLLRAVSWPVLNVATLVPVGLTMLVAVLYLWQAARRSH